VELRGTSSAIQNLQLFQKFLSSTSNVAHMQATTPSGRQRRGALHARGPLVEVEGFQRRLTTSIHYAPSLGALRDVLVQYQGEGAWATHLPAVARCTGLLVSSSFQPWCPSLVDCPCAAHLLTS
jgi:hypothetical protein